MGRCCHAHTSVQQQIGKIPRVGPLCVVVARPVGPAVALEGLGGTQPYVVVSMAAMGARQADAGVPFQSARAAFEPVLPREARSRGIGARAVLFRRQHRRLGAHTRRRKRERLALEGVDQLSGTTREPPSFLPSNNMSRRTKDSLRGADETLDRPSIRQVRTVPKRDQLAVRIQAHRDVNRCLSVCVYQGVDGRLGDIRDCGPTGTTATRGRGPRPARGRRPAPTLGGTAGLCVCGCGCVSHMTAPTTHRPRGLTSATSMSDRCLHTVCWDTSWMMYFPTSRRTSLSYGGHAGMSGTQPSSSATGGGVGGGGALLVDNHDSTSSTILC